MTTWPLGTPAPSSSPRSRAASEAPIPTTATTLTMSSAPAMRRAGMRLGRPSRTSASKASDRPVPRMRTVVRTDRAERSRHARATKPLTSMFTTRITRESAKMPSNSAMCWSAEILVVTTMVRAPTKNTTALMVTIELTN